MTVHRLAPIAMEAALITSMVPIIIQLILQLMAILELLYVVLVLDKVPKEDKVVKEHLEVLVIHKMLEMMMKRRSKSQRSQRN